MPSVLRSKIGLKVFVKLSPPSPSVVEYKRGSDAVPFSFRIIVYNILANSHTVKGGSVSTRLFQPVSLSHPPIPGKVLGEAEYAPSTLSMISSFPASTSAVYRRNIMALETLETL